MEVYIYRALFAWSLLGIFPWQFIYLRNWLKTHPNEMYKKDIAQAFVCSPLVGVIALIVYVTTGRRRSQWKIEHCGSCDHFIRDQRDCPFKKDECDQVKGYDEACFRWKTAN